MHLDSNYCQCAGRITPYELSRKSRALTWMVASGSLRRVMIALHLGAHLLMMSVLNEARSIIIRTPHCVFLGLDGVLPTSITRVTLKRYGLEPEIPKETFDRKTWTRLMSILFVYSHGSESRRCCNRAHGKNALAQSKGTNGREGVQPQGHQRSCG